MFVLAQKPRFWFTLIIYICSIITVTLAQRRFVFNHCENTKTYTRNSTYQMNLDTTLALLPTTNSGLGFFNSSTGEGNNIVYSIALCRADVHLYECNSCVSDSIVNLRKLCPDQKEAIGIYDHCLLQYSKNNLFVYPQKRDYFFQFNLKIATDVNGFNGALRSLMEKLIGDAAIGGPILKFATGNATAPDSTTIYGLVQCAPYLTEQQCRECLEDEVNLIKLNDNGKIGGKIVLPVCYFRFEIYSFVNKSNLVALPQPFPRSPLPPPPPGKKKNKTPAMIIIVVIVAIIVAILIASVCVFMSLRKKTKQTSPPLQSIHSETIDIETTESFQYNFSTIKAATNDFSEENKLGVGGFGHVYKGKLGNNREVAVKRLADDSIQGELEFRNEVLLVAKLHHRNLVRLFGFSIEGRERLLLYEYMPNGSLDKILFDPAKRKNFDWKKRYNILIDVAKGLLYLHEDSSVKIIHRDMKASNVLLGAKMNAKIADFGMARLFKQEETQGNTRRIVGTYGYMAPEYAMRGQFSVKSDVFSFGVLVLEMVTGQKNESFRNGENMEDLLCFTWERWKNNMVSDIIDPTLKTGPGTSGNIIRTIHIGLLCVQENVVHRPTMAAVTFMLNSTTITLPTPSEPAFYMRADTSEARSRSSQFFSVNDVSVSEISP